MTDDIPDTGVFVPLHGLTDDAEFLRALVSWHRGMAKRMHGRFAADGADDRDELGAVFALRVANALSVFVDDLEAGRSARLNSKFDAVLRAGGIDPDGALE